MIISRSDKHRDKPTTFKKLSHVTDSNVTQAETTYSKADCCSSSMWLKRMVMISSLYGSYLWISLTRSNSFPSFLPDVTRLLFSELTSYCERTSRYGRVSRTSTTLTSLTDTFSNFHTRASRKHIMWMLMLPILVLLGGTETTESLIDLSMSSIFYLSLFYCSFFLTPQLNTASLLTRKYWREACFLSNGGKCHLRERQRWTGVICSHRDYVWTLWSPKEFQLSKVHLHLGLRERVWLLTLLNIDFKKKMLEMIVFVSYSFLIFDTDKWLTALSRLSAIITQNQETTQCGWKWEQMWPNIHLRWPKSTPQRFKCLVCGFEFIYALIYSCINYFQSFSIGKSSLL